MFTVQGLRIQRLRVLSLRLQGISAFEGPGPLSRLPNGSPHEDSGFGLEGVEFRFNGRGFTLKVQGFRSHLGS